MGVQRAARLNTFSVGINGFVHERPAAPPRSGAHGGRRLGLPVSKKWRTGNPPGEQEAVEELGDSEGRVEPHLNFGELAAKEAFEEAGVVGYVSQSSVGMFRARRRSKIAMSRQIIEVWVYLFEVTQTRRKWPEMHKRQTRWASCQVAAQQVREPLLTALCHRLAEHRSAVYTGRRG
jgi:hypothetical protein